MCFFKDTTGKSEEKGQIFDTNRSHGVLFIRLNKRDTIQTWPAMLSPGKN